MTVPAIAYTIAPTTAVIVSAIASLRVKPSPALVSAFQHLAACVVFAAAATEILTQVKHDTSPVATLIGGPLGVGEILDIKAHKSRFKGSEIYNTLAIESDPSPSDDQCIILDKRRTSRVGILRCWRRRQIP